MRDWDTRINTLKSDIQAAREKYVIPFMKAQPKPAPPQKEVSQNPSSNPEQNKVETSAEATTEKLYENKDPISSLDLIDKTNEARNETNLGLTEEITNKIDSALEQTKPEEETPTVNAEEAPTVNVEEVVASAEEAPTVNVEEVVASAEEAPTVNVEEAVASAEEASAVNVEEAVASAEEPPTVNVEEAVASAEEAPTVNVEEAVASAEEIQKLEEIKVTDENTNDKEEGVDKNQTQKSELELLEERDEDSLTEEEEDRMYELRRLRAQKRINDEVREEEQAEFKKADEEIAHLKTLLKPKKKKLPKGYVE
ncbi:MAG: hypothetical protein CBD59_01940 [Alphaproteobacteria bacterium TMED199]|nr:MAG: hypothetical protein CBD59_01940 [Alphaproteobacteria bacterium TMED199]